MGVKCIDLETRKLAVTLTSYDVYNQKHRPTEGKDIGANEQVDEILDPLKKDDSLDPKQFNDLFEVLALACTEEYTGLGVAFETFAWTIKHHPILSIKQKH